MEGENQVIGLHLLNYCSQLDTIEVKFTDSPEASEKSREDCAPGAPHINFSAEPGVDVSFVNPTPLNGLFTVTVSLADGDTVERVKAKISKEVKAIKGIYLYTYHFLDV